MRLMFRIAIAALALFSCTLEFRPGAKRSLHGIDRSRDASWDFKPWLPFQGYSLSGILFNDHNEQQICRTVFWI